MPMKDMTMTRAWTLVGILLLDWGGCWDGWGAAMYVTGPWGFICACCCCSIWEDSGAKV